LQSPLTTSDFVCLQSFAICLVLLQMKHTFGTWLLSFCRQSLAKWPALLQIKHVFIGEFLFSVTLLDLSGVDHLPICPWFRSGVPQAKTEDPLYVFLCTALQGVLTLLLRSALFLSGRRPNLWNTPQRFVPWFRARLSHERSALLRPCLSILWNIVSTSKGTDQQSHQEVVCSVWTSPWNSLQSTGIVLR
jgi:hypothetical protein